MPKDQYISGKLHRTRATCHTFNLLTYDQDSTQTITLPSNSPSNRRLTRTASLAHYLVISLKYLKTRPEKGKCDLISLVEQMSNMLTMSRNRFTNPSSNARRDRVVTAVLRIIKTRLEKIMGVTRGQISEKECF